MTYSRSSTIEVSEWDRECIEFAAEKFQDEYPLIAPYLKKLAERLKANEKDNA